MSLDTTQRRWLIINALLITAIVNAGLNALFAWLGMHGRDHVVPWAWGPASTGTDTLGTLFVLPFVTCLLCTTAVRFERRSGSLTRLHGLRLALPWLAALPAPLVARAACCGAAVFAVLAVPVTLVLLLVDEGAISVSSFVAYKAIFGVVLGAAVTPLIALRAMAEP